MPYSIIQIYFVCKINDIEIKNCTTYKYIQGKKNGFKTPWIFHGFWVYFWTISENDAKMVGSIAVYLVGGYYNQIVYNVIFNYVM